MLDHALQLAGSPWIYAIVALIVLADGVFTALPSDTLVICCGALSLSGRPSLLGLVASAAAGSLAGDYLSYTLGKRLRSPRRGAAAVAFAGAQRALRRRGGVALVVGHFLPGGRTATTLAAGWMRFPPSRFWAGTAVAGVLWAVYVSGLGRLGGLAFADRPFLGAIPGVCFGTAVGVFLQVRSRRGGAGLPEEAEDVPGEPCGVPR